MSRWGAARAAATVFAALALGACAACSGPGSTTTTASAANSASTVVASRSADVTDSTTSSAPATSSPAPSRSPSVAATPRQPSARATTAKPVTTRTTHPVVVTTTAPFAKSAVGLIAGVLSLPQYGPDPDSFLVAISYSFDNGSTAKVCSLAPPTITYEYLDSSRSWQTATVTGISSNTCSSPRTLGTPESALAGPWIGPDTHFQAKVISISWRLTGPDGAWTATGT